MAAWWILWETRGESGGRASFMLVDRLAIRAGCCGGLRKRELMLGLGKRLWGEF